MNPFAAESTLPFHAPPFDKIKTSDFQPAIEQGMAAQLKEVEAIANSADAPTFENTIVAIERTGQMLVRASSTFFNLTGSATNDSLQAIKEDLAPKLAAHGDAISLDPKLFVRIKALYDQRTTLGLDPVSDRLLERYYTRFVRSGALLDEEAKTQMKKLNEEEAGLKTKFEDNILKERAALAVVVDDVKQLDGLTPDAIEAAAAAAKAKGQEGKWLIDLRNTTSQPALTDLKDRALRERVFKASISRNSHGGEYDNSKIITRLAQLRAEKAKLLGFPNWGAYVMDDQMAKDPATAMKLLSGMAPAAAKNAKAELAKLQALADKQKAGIQVEAWDWDFYAEQVRKAEFDLDEAAVKPYLEFESVLQNGVFYAANQLYGLSFKERKDLPVYQPDVRVFDIIDTNGEAIGLFYGDYYARDNKNGGAWMSSFVDQSTLLENQPVITQNCNYIKPAAGQPLLLSWDDVTTLFHEFGHALHGMMSDQKYPKFSGTATSTDFVEFPSQVNENWAMVPQVFNNYAKHYDTGVVMPKELAVKLRKASKFNQGYATTEYLAAALLDLEWHSLSADAPRVTDVAAFEAAALKKYGLDIAQVPPRYKSCYFNHSWTDYAANYYAYIWSEVMDADAFAWFNEHGGLTRANGDKFRAAILSQGGSKPEEQMYRDFTGRDPRVEPLLVKRGLK
ncbi:MAG: M3 family metallopeptidase [Flavobacteriales bacterium]|nr:M3 family metallopeptidase [Flavobacteriales bacterium]MBK6944892.1 M3 family metallopeptidase [Flavobacteriales bacterium]MBK7239242.1 M3 family metallopeptidase [Flavobacteriales bacterium]MBK9535554.1 M3 family metallopeptidase [Flavobacteriales bacterium]MBP9138916.1 M3 family metallopeptidase [Flavobacteriales bacterium]